MAVPFIAFAALGVVGAVGAAGLTAVVAHATSGDTAVVERVIDGDTIDVRIAGAIERVRLLNIDAPEHNKATGESECLGPEATSTLTSLLPSGTEVFLRYDDDRRDRYERLLAGVFVEDRLVNAEMTRSGLAGSLVVGENDRFFEDVAAAEQEAFDAHRGIYGEVTPCALGAVIATYRQQVTDASAASPPVDSAGLAAAIAAAITLSAAADAVDESIDAVTWVPPRLAQTLQRDTRAIAAEARGYEQRLGAALDAAHEKEAAEAEAARVAAEQAAAEQAATEAARRAEAERNSGSTRGGSSAPGGSGSGSTGGGSGSGSTGGYDGYTGCRAYGSRGSSVDEKGRPYTKIDCTTKLPLG